MNSLGQYIEGVKAYLSVTAQQQQPQPQLQPAEVASTSTVNTLNHQPKCCVCFKPTELRGGSQFLTTPGCCERLIHEACLNNYISRGGKNCPNCRTPFQQLVQESTSPVRDVVDRPQDPQIDSASIVLKLQAIPEFPVESIQGNPDFHVRVTLEFEDNDDEETQPSSDDRNPLDIVCVIDNSGSMSGEKLQNLKKAIEFVLSVLNEKDRLSLVTFNSHAHVLTNLEATTSDMKTKLRTEVLPSVHAGGGTDIYAGLRSGYEILQQRTNKSSHSIMFLLTDGQDRSRLEEKKAMAREMRAEHGTALFAFGFGADHDSEHMLTIANACEGNFVYIDTNAAVVEAFGGAIGSQQGHVLRNITVNVAALSPSVIIHSVSSGVYGNNILANGTGASVTLMDLFRGEKRDFLLELALPAVTTEVTNYPLVSVAATYSVAGGADGCSADTVSCAIERLSEDNQQFEVLYVRDHLVDEDMFRIRCKDAMAKAIELADDDDFTAAKETLQKAITALKEKSLAYRSGSSALLNGMLNDLQDCLTRTQSREEYEYRGGKAMISEHCDGYRKQRKAAGKSGCSSFYQTKKSRCAQMYSRTADVPEFSSGSGACSSSQVVTTSSTVIDEGMSRGQKRLRKGNN